MNRRSVLPVTALLLNTLILSEPRRPPQMAIAACESKRSGDLCAFADGPRSIQGKCRHVPGGLTACVPDHHRHDRDSGDRPDHRPANRVRIQNQYSDAIPVKSRIPDTHQGSCFNEIREMPCPASGGDFYGQDAHYKGAMPVYIDNRNGTITDHVTGLLWQKAHNDRRLNWYEARSQCQALTLGGYKDWRLPTIKELFTIADFRGTEGIRPYIDDIFEIKEPGIEIFKNDPFASTHHPSMMGQTWSSTLYTGQHMGLSGVEAAFFFNFLDGRIKQAPTRGRSRLFYRCVRGEVWGANRFRKLNSHVVADDASELQWQVMDSGKAMVWKSALQYCESSTYAGYSDWRLPNIKELQSIVDYSKNDPALNLDFFKISDENAWFWSSTTLGDNVSQAAYICFGKCTSTDGRDVHGAGGMRSDPKTGNPADYTKGQGGQRDEIRVMNYVRCVR